MINIDRYLMYQREHSYETYIDGIVQHRSISNVNALEILQSCTKPMMTLSNGNIFRVTGSCSQPSGVPFKLTWFNFIPVDICNIIIRCWMKLLILFQLQRCNNCSLEMAK